MSCSLRSIDEIGGLFHQCVHQPTLDYELFEKAEVFNEFRVNLGLDYQLFYDTDKIICSELFVNILMRDLLAFTILQEDSDDYQLIRRVLLSFLKTKKSGIIWRFVSEDLRVRVEFLMSLDTRKFPIARKYFGQLSDVYLQDAFIDGKKG